MRKKKLFAALLDFEMKCSAQLLSFLTQRLDFASTRRQLDLYRKKEHLNVQVDFQDFFIQLKKKKMKGNIGSSPLEKQRSSSFHMKLHHCFYDLSSFLEYQCFGKSLLP